MVMLGPSGLALLLPSLRLHPSGRSPTGSLSFQLADHERALEADWSDIALVVDGDLTI